MKSVRFHPASLGAGAVLCLLLLASLGAVQAPAFVRVAVVEPVPVHGVPRPDQMVRIVEGAPFTVPTDKRLVLTGVGHAGEFSGLVVIQVDRQPFLKVSNGTGSDPFVLPAGCVVEAGSEVTSAPEGSVLFGYLVDA